MKIVKTAEGPAKLKISKAQWLEIGKKAGWDNDQSHTERNNLEHAIGSYPKSEVVKVIKSLGEESIAGFSDVREEDVEEIIAMAEIYVLGEIKNALERTPVAASSKDGAKMIMSPNKGPRIAGK